MGKALALSLLLHISLISAMIWSTQLSLMLLKARQQKLENLGVVEVDLLYKPTETKMRKGEAKQDLPPPEVKSKTAVEPEPSPVVKTPPKKQKPKPKPKPKKEPPKKNFDALFSKLRQETGDDARRAPRDDNFPTREDGEKDARGTGGTAKRELSPGELALQTAFRKYFELPRRTDFVKKHPNASGFMSVRLIGTGNTLELVSMKTLQSTGFDILDQSCEMAIIKAIENEAFERSVISELNGKETNIQCSP